MINFKEKYGPTALIAGASEGLGAAWSHALAARGLDLILIARRPEPLAEITRELTQKFGVNILPLTIDLAAKDAAEKIITTLGDRTVDLFVYNAAASHIGPFLAANPATHLEIAAVNMLTPLALLRSLGEKMVGRRRGGIILMSSVAGFQGSGFLATYAATKAFTRILAESLWYEWRPWHVDVIACCAGATSTPNYHATNPGKASPFEPRPQQPQQVVEECLRRIGTTPSFVSGAANKWITFFMQHILSKKAAISVMSDGLKKMYRLLPLLALAPILLFSHACHTPNKVNINDTLAALPFRNPGLPIDQRVDDLVSRMTLEEKIGQMMNAAPAIPRLGIPEYNWWNECLHGVARAGLATVFPAGHRPRRQPGTKTCNSAWPPPSPTKPAPNTTNSSARANDIYQGLTFWSPNINIFRDPRWGRGRRPMAKTPS